MGNHFWLTDAQMKRFFPKSHGKMRVDDWRVLSGTMPFIRNGLRWCDAPRGACPAQGPQRSLQAVGRIGVFARMMVGLAAEGSEEGVVLIEATHLKAHRTAVGLRAKSGRPDDTRKRLIGRTNGGLNSRFNAVTDAKGRPLRVFRTVGLVSDRTGAAAKLGSPLAAEWLVADRGDDADWFREALKDKGIGPCIPGRKSREKADRYDSREYNRRSQIKIMFCCLKD